MKLSLVFRTAIGSCLAFSTACLGYVEQFHLDPYGVTAFYVSVGALILMAFLLEDRWVMPALVANILALAIAGCWLAWFFSDVPTPGEGLDAKTWILPRLGPLLTILLLAKVRRPKHPADYWVLQGLALVQVTLACVLADAARRGRIGDGDKDPVFVFILLGYLVAGVWSMILFYLHRESVSSDVHRPHDPSPPPATPLLRLPWRLQGARQAGVWFVLGGVLSLCLFFLVPWPGKSEGGRRAGQRPPQTGFNTDLNLNNTSRMEVNRDVAMRVAAYDTEGKRLNLGPDIRWRGTACANYSNGRWQPFFTSDFEEEDIKDKEFIRPERHDIRLSYQIDLDVVYTGRRRVNRPIVPLFLAEPVFSRRSGCPVIGNAQRFFFEEAAWNPFESTILLENRAYGSIGYEQILRPAVSKDDWTAYVGPPFSIDYAGALTFVAGADEDPESLISEVTRRAKEILAAAGVKPGDSAEKKARALSSHLSQSGEFTDSLEGLGPNTKRDPTVEFLTDVKRGDCKFFASALALMLRSQNIPARVVIGYRGNDWDEERKVHVVRQEHAHAWVEAWLPRTDAGGRRVEGWLTLDPTPVVNLGALARAGGVAESERPFTQEFWDFLLDYNSGTHRDRILARLQVFGFAGEFFSQLVTPSAWTLGGVLVAVAVIAAVAGLLVVLRRLTWARHTAAGRLTATVPFYVRLLRLMARLRLRPRPVQTPREFAAESAGVLTVRPGTALVADVPPEVVAAFYEVRFGGRTLPADEAAAVERSLDRLEQQLTH